jgi:hypothetical protein
MIARLLNLHDETLNRYRKLGLNNSTIAWLLFAEGLFVVMMIKVLLAVRPFAIA